MLGLIDDVEEVVRQHDIDTVVLALPRDAHVRLVTLVNLLQRLPVRLHVVPDYFDLAFHHATLTTLGGIPLIGLRDPAIDGIQRFCKRLIDLGLASAGLFALSPLFLAVALAIRLEDNGPIFYRAQRVGENGRLFYMLKFRSMCIDADRMRNDVGRRDADGNVIYKNERRPAHYACRPLYPPHQHRRAAPAHQRLSGRNEHRWPAARAALAGGSVRALAAQTLRRAPGHDGLVAGQRSQR